jgi:hypothetical protein
MSYYDFHLTGFKPITKKDSLKQLKTRIQANYDEDLNEEIHQVMDVLRTLEGQKFTKRLHPKIYDVIEEKKLLIGVSSYGGYRIQRLTSGYGWEDPQAKKWDLRLTDSFTNTCPVINIEDIEDMNSCYFRGAKERNEERDKFFANPLKQKKIADLISIAATALSELEKEVEYPFTDRSVVTNLVRPPKY